VLLHALTSRQLATFETQVAPGPSEPLTWLVYRSASELDPYASIAQASSPLVSNEGSAAAPALGVPLEADAYYLVGVGVSGPHTIQIADGVGPAALSFGQLLGGYTLTLPGGGSTIPGRIRIGVGELGDGLTVRITTSLKP
jgi:hypothetical protein